MTDQLDSVIERVVTLQPQRYAVMEAVPKALLSSAKMEASKWVEFTQDRLVLRLSAYMLEQQVDEQYLEYPADWWEAVKLRWFPAWALRRWPVRYTHWRASVCAAYPDRTIPGERTVIVTRYERLP